MSTRSKRYQKQSRARNRRRVVKPQQSTAELWALLVVVLLVTVIWAWWHISPDLLRLLEITGIAILLILVLLVVVWFVLRSRPTSEDRALRDKQRDTLRRANETAQAIGAREIELDDLRYLTRGKPGDEFEDFTAALLIAMGVASELERVGGSGDGGIDLRGKDASGLPFVVQCKHIFGHSVSAEQARGFGWAMSRRAAYKGWYVTTWTFSDPARGELAPLIKQGRLVLVEGRDLVSHIREHWNALPDCWQWRLTECMVKGDCQQRVKR